MSGEPLLPDEARLLRAYRILLNADRADLLRQAEKRAREVSELEMRLRAERGAAGGASGKRLRPAA